MVKKIRSATKANRSSKESIDSHEPDSGYNGDVFLYYGDVSYGGYHQISTLFEQTEDKKQKVCLILVTRGGDPDAAYRIARAMNHHYGRVEILIPDICKSAGTLLCIGAHKLIFGDRGELGPLDVQISKPDELSENMSGLDNIQALDNISDQMLNAFRTYLVDIRFRGHLQTKMAADIAAKLAMGFISPIAAKLDPVTLGAHLRAMRIGHQYGVRLDETVKSLKPQALNCLVSGYPSHEFVIDRKEATTLFNDVVSPDKVTDGFYRWARDFVGKIPYPEIPLVSDYKLLKHEKETDAT